MAKPITLYYDFLSPYSYLAHHQLVTTLRDQYSTIQYRPIATLEVMKRVNNSPTTLESRAKGQYAQKDVIRWAIKYGAPIALNPHLRSTDPTPLYLGALAAEQQNQMETYTTAIFAAVWANAVNLSDADEMQRVLTEAGIENPEQLLANAQQPDIKQQLETNNDLAVEFGVFGVPSIMVGDELFFGNDRLDFVVEELNK